MSGIGHNKPPTFSSDAGWVAIARSMRDHPLVGFHLFAKPMDKNRGGTQPALAFIDLIMECQYEDGTVMNGGRRMDIKRGELVGAISFLAHRWNWTPKAVRGWLDRLEEDGMIARFQRRAETGKEIGTEKGNQNGNQSSFIRLCNYDIYQSTPNARLIAEGQLAGNQGAIEGQSKGNNNKDNKLTNNNPPSGEAPLEAIGEIKGLNGATIAIVQEFAGWLNPFMPDLALAHQSIVDACSIYGGDAVKDGFAELKAQIADGKVRAPNVKNFYGFVRTASTRAKARTADARTPSKRVPRPEGKTWKEMNDEIIAEEMGGRK